MDPPLEKSQAGPEGIDGQALETCRPIEWGGVDLLNEPWMRALFCRLRACAYREPELLSLFGFSRQSMIKLLADVRFVLSHEQTIETVDVPLHGHLHVFGDIHGDFFSLWAALDKTGWPAEGENGRKLVVAGDLIDRGPWGVEVLIAIFALKLWQPRNVIIIRGNHESESTIARYGFAAEVVRKYDLRVQKLFMHTVRELPLAAIVQSHQVRGGDTARALAPGKSVGKANTKRVPAEKQLGKQTRQQRRAGGKTEEEESGANSSGGAPWASAPPVGTRRVLVVHGGLWREKKVGSRSTMKIGSLADLAAECRQVDDPEDCIAEDVLWSDPSEVVNVMPNHYRGAGILYGSGAVESFFKREHLCGLIRGHEGPDMRKLRPEMRDMDEGFSVDMDMAAGYVATVFTSADYPVGSGHGNKGAIATLAGRAVVSAPQLLPKFTTFTVSRPEPGSIFYTPMPERPATPR